MRILKNVEAIHHVKLLVAHFRNVILHRLVTSLLSTLVLLHLLQLQNFEMLLVFHGTLPKFDGAIVKGYNHCADWIKAWEVNTSDASNISHTHILQGALSLKLDVILRDETIIINNACVNEPDWSRGSLFLFLVRLIRGGKLLGLAIIETVAPSNVVDPAIVGDDRLFGGLLDATDENSALIGSKSKIVLVLTVVSAS